MGPSKGRREGGGKERREERGKEIGGSFACTLEVEQYLIVLHFTTQLMSQPFISPILMGFFTLYGQMQKHTLKYLGEIKSDKLQISMK